MRIYLIRHGESTVNAGTSAELDCGLSPRGRQQAAALATALAQAGIAWVFSSPYRRTMETAEEIRQVTGAKAELLPDVHENHLGGLPDGPWPLPSRSEILEAFPGFDAPPDMPETEWAVRREDGPGEWQRLGRAVENLQSRFQAQLEIALAVVTHQGPGTYFIKQFLGLKDPKLFGVQLDNGSITILERLKDGRPSLRCLNCLPPLEA